MLYAIRSNTFYVRTKIAWKNIAAKIRSKPAHPSNYQAGYSPDTDNVPVINEELGVQSIAARQQAHNLGWLHPTAHLLIFSPDSRYILMQCRASGKDSSGNLLGQSVGGHVGGTPEMVGQKIKQEIILAILDKETWEEAGIRGLSYLFCQLFRYNSSLLPSQHIYRNQEMAFLFTSRYSGRAIPNPTEVKWMGWFSIDGIYKLLNKKPWLFSPSFRRDLAVYNEKQRKTKN